MALEYLELGERLVVDLLDVAVVERRARQRQQVQHADQRFLRTEQVLEGHE